MSTQEQYFEKVLKTSATMLGRWKGASAALWELTAAHKSLRIEVVCGSVEVKENVDLY